MTRNQTTRSLFPLSNTPRATATDRQAGTLFSILRNRTRASDPNNTLATATDLGAIVGKRILRNSVGRSDPNDFFKVIIGNTSRIRLSFQNLSANNISGAILDSTGQIARNDDGRLTGTAKGGQTGTLLFDNVAPGVYFLKLRSTGPGNNRYRLTLNVTDLTMPVGTDCGCGS
jgi:hypothetical protein